MSESTLLITASTAMLALSLLVAGVLIWLNVGPGVVIIGGTIAGIVAYVGLWVMGSRYVKKDIYIEEEQNA